MDAKEIVSTIMAFIALIVLVGFMGYYFVKEEKSLEEHRKEMRNIENRKAEAIEKIANYFNEISINL